MINSVLIVDDSQSQLDVLAVYLAELGVKDVVRASNGREALKKLDQEPYRFQLLITDLKMPIMDGMQLIEAVAATDFSAGVVIYSSLEERIVELAINLARKHQIHLVGNLSKPFSISDLQLMLDRGAAVLKRSDNDLKTYKHKQIIDAVEQGSLVPYFQPQIDCVSMDVVGFEVLCRIKVEGEPQFLKPEHFMTIVEHRGLIDLLTFKNMEIAIREFRKISEHIPESEKITLAINILPEQLNSEKLPDILKSICNLNSFDVERVVIEITERQAIDTTRKVSTLQRLRILGFGVSLDDFGTGFTNMGQIRRYPFTEIKMDRSMIQGIHADRVSQVILNTMVELANSFDINIVAEGVESPLEFDYLSSLPRIFVQGYLVSRPKPASEIVRWFNAWKKQIRPLGGSTKRQGAKASRA